MNDYACLKRLFKRLSHLQYLQRILSWDEAVMMPEGAGQARAHALATLNLTMQKILINKKTKQWLDAAKREHLSPWDAVNLQWMEKKYQRAIVIPPKLTEQATKASLACEQAWRRLRAENNWQGFLPYLHQSFQFVKEIAERKAQVSDLSPYDALLDEYVPGFDQARINNIFATLQTNLPPLVEKIIAKQQTEAVQLPIGPFPFEKQKMLGLTVMQALGFDFAHGRLDTSHHPFCSGGPKDVRITTRYFEDEFVKSLMAICHETGHALYEQGLPKKWLNQPVGQVESMAMHESQSLLIEMQVCCSSEFYEYLASHIQHFFGRQAAFQPDNLFKLITRVKPSLIRVDADEATYPLHVILRYEIEKRLFTGEIAVEDLPTFWNEMMTKFLGISTLNNYQHGVMQDVHWPSGAFGYFPAYTLGRLMAAQFFAAYTKEQPQYAAEIKQGNFVNLTKWLKRNIYAEASCLPTKDLLIKVTGSDLDANYFLQHIKERYLGD